MVIWKVKRFILEVGNQESATQKEKQPTQWCHNYRQVRLNIARWNVS